MFISHHIHEGKHHYEVENVVKFKNRGKPFARYFGGYHRAKIQSNRIKFDIYDLFSAYRKWIQSLSKSHRFDLN